MASKSTGKGLSTKKRIAKRKKAPTRKPAAEGGSQKGPKGKPKARSNDKLRKTYEALQGNDNSGCMSAAELRASIQALGYESQEEEVENVLAEIKERQDGMIEIHQFQEMLLSRLGESGMRREAERAFRLFGRQLSELITISDLRRVARELGESLSDTDLQEMIRLADPAKRGGVVFDQFYLIMSS